jgi:hypothetical protein
MASLPAGRKFSNSKMEYREEKEKRTGSKMKLVRKIFM